MQKTKLLENLRTYFNKSELQDLCYSINIDFENLTGTTKTDKTRELVDHCIRHGIYEVLIDHCMELRPQAKWQSQSSEIFIDSDKDPATFVFAKERSQITEHYTQCALGAKEIEIITLTMQAMLENYGEKRLLSWVKNGKRIQIMVLSPVSMAAKVRSKEEGIDIPKKILAQFERFKTGVYDKIMQLKASGEKVLGSLEIRIYDGLPYLAYFRADEHLIVGFYYSQIKGLQSDSLYIGEKSTIYPKMIDYFKHLWESSNKENPTDHRIVCKISESDSNFFDFDILK